MALIDEETKGQIRERLAKTLTGPVELRLYWRPDSGRLILPGGCPYCPGAAAMANRMALASPKVHAIVVEANEYPELAQRHQVQGVPRTLVRRSGAFVGALLEPTPVESVPRLATGETA